MCSEQEPSVAARLDRLFETFHSRTEPEQSLATVAASVGEILGYPVSAATVGAQRTDGVPPDLDLLSALAQHFGVRQDYLTGSGADVAVLHHKLKLLADARDAGLQRLALRGGVPADTEVLDKILGILDRLDDRP